MDIEKDVEKTLIKAVRDAGGRCLKWVSPGNAGVPDRICLFHGGVIGFVELKRPTGGKVAARQKAWARILQLMGFTCEIVSTKEEAVAVVAKITGGANG